MNEFHFLRPAWLLALPFLLALLYGMARRSLRSRSWAAVCDPELLPHLLVGRSQRRANWPLWLLLAALLLGVLSLAGPAWRKEPHPLFHQESALVILLDLSRSMDAGDLEPSRLERARLKIKDLLRLRREGETALIAFAGDAFVVTPLTTDQRTIGSLLDTLDPELMPVQGSRPQQAIELGTDLLLRSGRSHGRLLLLTDEDRPETTLAAAAALRKKGFDLSILGVGTTAGAPIPLPGGGFFKDDRGALVLPRLDEGGLSRLAAAGGGSYRRIAVDDSDLQGLLAGLESRRLDSAREEPGAEGSHWREEGIWLLFPLLLLAPLGFRRGWLVLLALVLLPTLPAQASSWSDLWQNPDQQGAEAFANRHFEEAGAAFQDRRWKASALYRAGRFQEAAETLASPESADDFYNRGNALARSGDLPQALAAYDEALKLDPEHADAQTNREVVEKALKQEEKQPNKEGERKPQEGGTPKDDEEKGMAQKEKNDSGQKKSDSPPQDGSKTPEPGKEGDRPTPAPQDPAGAEEKDGEKSKETVTPQKTDNSTVDQEESPPPPKGEASMGAEDQDPGEEKDRAARQWLQRVPDDPGGLLRRKFLYQYRQRGRQMETDRPW